MALKAKFDSVALNTNIANLKKLQEIKFSKALAEDVGNAIIDEMKDLISKGISPIKGGGRYESYKQSYADKIKSKKGVYANKGLKPVNLNLTGQFLGSLTHKVKALKNKLEISIGYNNKLARDKEDGHRYGSNSQKIRPTLPLGSEGFAVVIQKKVIDIVNKYIIEQLKKK